MGVFKMAEITPESFLQREVVMAMHQIREILLDLDCSELYQKDDEFAKLFRNLCKSFQDIEDLAKVRRKAVL